MASSVHIPSAEEVAALHGQDLTQGLRPQPGPQTVFMATEADIAFMGGAAGGGKSYAILLEPLRHIHVKGFGAVIFRRTYAEVRKEGSLWDTSQLIYPRVGGKGMSSRLTWNWTNYKSKVQFAHMEHEEDRFQWDGSQICLLCFDQLEHFTWKQFTYMLSRNRSTCGVPSYVRATLNPAPDHWLRWFLDWWIDDKTGVPIPERSGVIRYFVMRGDNVDWADTPEELKERHGPDSLPKSFTFVASTIHDNKILLAQDPGYLASLQALPFVERARLLGSNWNVREGAGTYFRKEWFTIVDPGDVPYDNFNRRVRYWDRAATDANHPSAKEASHTAGTLESRDNNGRFWIEDCETFQRSPGQVQARIKARATADGRDVFVGFEQEPGASGKAEAADQVKNLAGIAVGIINPVRESKASRAKMLSAQSEAGNVFIVRGPWNEPFLSELENYDGSKRCPADRMDSASGAHHLVTQVKVAGTWGRR